MSEPGKTEVAGPDISPVRRNNLNPGALRNSIARAQERGKLPIVSENPPEKVSTPPTIQKVVPPFIEDVPETPPARNHEQAMDFFHKAQKEYRGHQPAKPTEKASTSSFTAKKDFDVAAARKSIAHAQELGTWPILEKPAEKVPVLPVTPPFVKDVPQPTPTRTHEENMDFFHKALNLFRGNNGNK